MINREQLQIVFDEFKTGLVHLEEKAARGDLDEVRAGLVECRVAFEIVSAEVLKAVGGDA